MGQKGAIDTFVIAPPSDFSRVHHFVTGTVTDWLANNLPGVSIPESVIRRLEGADDEAAEGRRLCADLLAELRQIEGVDGAHLMAPRQEEAIARVVADSGLLAARRAAG